MWPADGVVTSETDRGINASVLPGPQGRNGQFVRWDCAEADLADCVPRLQP